MTKIIIFVGYKAMKKALKIILSTVSGLIIFIITLPIALSIVLQISVVQNYVVEKVSAKLSEIAKTKISISHVALEFFTSARFSDVYMEDYRGDTMIYAKDVRVSINGINFITGKISLGSTTLSDGQVNLYRYESGIMNIAEVFENFKPKVAPVDPPNFRLSATELNLLRTRFTMTDALAPDDPPHGVNYKRMQMRDIDFQAKDISVFNHNIWLTIEHLSLAERSGLKIDHMSSRRCGVDSSGMYYSDVILETRNSTMKLDSMNFLTANQSWWDWNDFEHKMILSAIVEESEVSTITLGYLAGLSFAEDSRIGIGAARLRGAIVDMKGWVKDVALRGNAIDAGFSIVGLPSVDSTVFGLELHRLQATGTSIADAVRSFTGDTMAVGMVDMINRIGQINVEASLKGTIKDFTSIVNLRSDAGNITASAVMSPSAVAGSMQLSGGVSTEAFDVGRLADVKKLGQTKFSTQYRIYINPKLPLTIDAKAEIAKLHYGAYDFNSITIDGRLASRKFDGSIASSDPNFRLKAEGHFDMGAKIPQYKVDLSVDKANFAAIGLNQRDSISLLTAKLVAEGSGTTIDDFNGHATIDNILYLTELDTVKASAIRINSIAEPKYRQLDITSHFADVKLRGRNSFTEIFRYFSQSMQRFLPSFPEASSIVGQKEWGAATKAKKIKRETSFPFSDGFYQLTIDVKEANNVAAIFIPTLEIARGSSLNFFFNPYLDQFTLRAKSDYIGSDDFLVEDLSVDSRNHVDSLSLYATASYFSVGAMELPNFSLLGGICKNRITLGAQFRDEQDKTSALLNTTTSFLRTPDNMPQMCVEIHPTPLMFKGNAWSLVPSTILLDTLGVSVSNFAVYNAAERFSLDGRIGKSIADTITFRMSNADISPATMLISDLGYTISGKASGEVRVVSLLSDAELFAAIDFRDVYLSNFPLGNSQLRSTLDRKRRRVNFALGDDLLNAPLTGFYDVDDMEYGADIKFEKFDMRLLEPMLKGILTSTSGSAVVDLELRGKGDRPVLSGVVDVNDYSVVVDYTRARYTIDKAKIKVANSCFSLPSTPIRDKEIGRGEISAELRTKYFKDLTYDIGASFTNLLALNTTIADNNSFYGKAYGTGRIDIRGNETKTSLEVSAETALNSELILPLSGASTIEQAGFIRFVSPKEQADSLTPRRRIQRARRQNANELDIRLNMHILPNALAQIELDAKMGDVIKGRGEGRLMMHINPTLDIFTMTGPVEISQGSYRFTMQPFIDKYFTVSQGGQLLWTGDPTNPEVNLTAIYQVKKVSLTPLVGTGGDATMGSAKIDCGIVLSGKLFAPDIQFSITAPSADPEVQNFIRNSINTQEALSMQFIWLLAANSFMADMGAASIGTMSGSLVGVTGLEFLSNQLSNLISNDKFNIRFGYRPQSTTSSDEFYAGVGADLIADVLTIEVDGNYNTQNNPTYRSNNPFTVDATMTWNINKKGTLKLKGFTRTIDRFDETQGMQESGVGIYFRQDFNDLADLKARLKKSYGVDSAAIARNREKRLENREKRNVEKKSKEAQKKKEQAAGTKREKVELKIEKSE